MFLLQVFSSNPIQGVAWVLGFLLALSVHEAAHAYAADYLGDPTARFAGRVTLNPAAHLDPFGTLLLFFLGFGWGRPVPINPGNFRNRRAGEILTSLAGPLSNFCVALVLALPLNFLTTPGSGAYIFLQTVIFLNVIIMVFNLLPIPPLDGGGVVAALLPVDLAVKYLQKGPVVLFVLILADYILHIGILSQIIFSVANIVRATIDLATTFGVS